MELWQCEIEAMEAAGSGAGWLLSVELGVQEEEKVFQCAWNVSEILGSDGICWELIWIKTRASVERTGKLMSLSGKEKLMKLLESLERFSQD